MKKPPQSEQKRATPSGDRRAVAGPTSRPTRAGAPPLRARSRSTSRSPPPPVRRPAAAVVAGREEHRVVAPASRVAPAPRRHQPPPRRPVPTPARTDTGRSSWLYDTSPPGSTAQAPAGRPAAAGNTTITDFDERPIQARGYYDLSFFDTDNEYESYGMEVMQRDEARFQAFFQRYLAHLNTDFVTDEDFDREFTYERLLDLDAQLMKRGGLTSAELRKLLRPMRGIEAECVICMETSSKSDKMARLVCDHAFHCACLQQWLAENHTCPLCRKDLRVPADRAAAAAAAGEDGVVGREGFGDDEDSDDEAEERIHRSRHQQRRRGDDDDDAHLF